MCMFTFPNKASIKARLKGIEKFECGSCPECLQKKSRLWALRCSMEAKVNYGVMVTLTYDTYKYVGTSSIEENPTDPTISLSKRHCQLFIKRLRKHFKGRTIKYVLTAERGKKTNRAHYHALLFGVSFDDLTFYKNSKRGNRIYKSKTLEKIWSHGICTVDSINLSAKVARYCTKYCCKDSGGNDDTFMLFSRGIGEEMLLKKFNGKSYYIEGREYSIPRIIWQRYIEKKYNIIGYSRYVGRRTIYDTEKKIYNQLIRYEKDVEKYGCSNFNERDIWKSNLQKLAYTDISYLRQQQRRELYQYYRDNDPLYRLYIKYWHNKAKVYDINRPTELQRILSLDDKKYWSYKQKAIKAKACAEKKFDFRPPRSKIQAFLKVSSKKEHEEKSFAPLSSHYRANDTINPEISGFYKKLLYLKLCIMERYATPLELSPF